jgi:hypothetical protein
MLALSHTKKMEAEFVAMVRVVCEDSTCRRLGLHDIPVASLEDLFKECAKRIVSDSFLLGAGRRLFFEYFLVRIVSRSIFGWLYADEARPAFLS